MKKLFVLLLFVQQAATAQLTSLQQLKIDSMINQFVETKQFSGVVLVAKNNQVLYQRAVGYADKENKILNTVNSNFNIASMGKTFTATMIMQLVQEGKLRLEETVQAVLPGYKIKRADSITVFHLLTHTSGVGNYMEYADYEENRNTLKSLADVMPYVVAMEPTMNRVGERFDYSNSGFIILGRIIEKITGKTYEQNLEERIFRKAGINNSYIHHPATFQSPKEAFPYLAYTANTFVNAVSDEFPAFSDGGMQSNAVDLYRFANALLSNQLLKPEMRDSMWNGKIEMGRNAKYSFGWMDNANEYGKNIYSHDGGGKGFSSDLKIVKEDGYVIVVLINNRVNPRDVSENILRILYKGTYNKPEKYLENKLMETVEQKGFNYVKDNYNAVIKEYGFDKTPNHWVYIMFSDMFESMKKLDEAFMICEMGRKEFPKEASLCVVTGQLFLVQKKYQEAAAWFHKALDIDPNDEYAKMMLNKVNSKLK